jgi:hypothetical protein
LREETQVLREVASRSLGVAEAGEARRTPVQSALDEGGRRGLGQHAVEVRDGRRTARRGRELAADHAQLLVASAGLEGELA